MAEAWVARRREPLGAHKLVVVKRILEHQARNPSFINAFIDEARLAIRLNHPHIVQVLEIGDDDGHPYLVLELVDGLDLERLLERLAQQGRPLPIAAAVQIGAALLRALDYAHRLTDEAGQPLGIIHRDVSPPNVLLGRNGEIKLADFGIAKAKGRLTKTAFGLLKGKAPYMSPEQALGQALDQRSDLFSTGALLWECLTGRRLFDGAGDLATLQLVQAAQVAAPSTWRKEVSPDLDHLILRLLAKDREQRFPTARQALAQLEATPSFRESGAGEITALVQELAGESPTVMPLKTDFFEEDGAPARTAPKKIEIHGARHWWIWAAVVCLIIICIVWLLFVYRGTSPDMIKMHDQLRQASLLVRPETSGVLTMWDDLALGIAPLSKNFPPDGKRHQLTLLRPGYQPWRQTFHFSEPRTVDARQHLVRQSGRVRVEGDASWRLAGQTLDAGEELILPTGTYVAEGAGVPQRMVTVLAGQTITLPPRPFDKH